MNTDRHGEVEVFAAPKVPALRRGEPPSAADGMGVPLAPGSVPGYVSGQSKTSAIDAALDGSFRYAENLGHFLIAQAMDVAENNGSFGFRRQSAQGSAKKPGGFVPLQLFLLPGFASVLEVHDFGFPVARMVERAPRAAISIDDQVPAQPHGPTAEVPGFHMEALQVLEDPDEYLLGEVFRLIRPVGVTVAHGEDGRGVGAYHDSPGCFVSHETTPDEHPVE
jgi:hypothetical protein